MFTLQKRAIYEFESFGRVSIVQNPFKSAVVESTKIHWRDFVLHSLNISISKDRSAPDMIISFIHKVKYLQLAILVNF